MVAKSLPHILGSAFVFIFSIFLGFSANASTISINPLGNSVRWFTPTTYCNWNDARTNTACIQARTINFGGNGGEVGIRKYDSGGHGYLLDRSSYNFDLSSALTSTDNITGATLSVVGWGTSLSSANNIRYALYISSVDGLPNSSSFTDADSQVYCSAETSQRASVNDYSAAQWNTSGANLFVLNDEAIATLSAKRFSYAVFCIKTSADALNIEPTSPDDFIRTEQTTLVTLNIDITSGGFSTLTYAQSGITLSPVWKCCSGICENGITALAQTGWWGYGTTSKREILYGIDNDCTSNPLPYYVNLTNKTTATTTISTSTALGWHNACIDYYLNDIYQFRWSQPIQIIANDACVSTTTPDNAWLPYCAVPCIGIVTSTNPLDLNNLRCGLQEFGCWLTVVDSSAMSNLANSWNQTIHRFPLAPITKFFDDVNLMSTGTQAIAAGTIAIPTWSTTTTHFEAQNYDLSGGTTTEHVRDKFRRFSRIAAWCLSAGAIVAITIALIV